MAKNNFLSKQNKPEMKTRKKRKIENKVEKFKKQKKKKIKNYVVVLNNNLIQT